MCDRTAVKSIERVKRGAIWAIVERDALFIIIFFFGLKAGGCFFFVFFSIFIPDKIDNGKTDEQQVMTARTAIILQAANSGLTIFSRVIGQLFFFSRDRICRRGGGGDIRPSNHRTRKRPLALSFLFFIFYLIMKSD